MDGCRDENVMTERECGTGAEQAEKRSQNGTKNGNDTELERSKGWNEIGITR